MLTVIARLQWRLCGADLQLPFLLYRQHSRVHNHGRVGVNVR